MQTPKVKTKSNQALKTDLPTGNYLFADFDVVREEWNKYKLEDGTIVKSKFVLINVLLEKNLAALLKEARKKKGSKTRMGLWIQSRNVLGVEAPMKLRGQPSAPSAPQETESSIIKKDMDFDVIKEKRNKYRLKNGIRITVRHSPMEISKTNKYDTQGIPIYTVNSTADVKFTLPEKVQKELRALEK